MKYETVIGLEIHAELKTNTKIFCGCSNDFGSHKNSRCCPVCTGLPGALPVLNKHVIELAIAAGLCFGCEITRETKWDRKNYFYPDNSKAYQISQLFAPLCVGGGLNIDGKFIRLNRIHVEEDAGKLVHEGDFSAIDFNRGGVPLIEIVTEPDIRSSEEAVKFVEKIREALVYAGVCDGKMEQGSLRCDANISVMPVGSEKFGLRTEVKNLNSFKFIKKAIDFEVVRHIETLESGGKLYQETRRYDEVSGETFSMRSKENAHDYRYFPDPDILPLFVSNEDIEKIKNNLPELPEDRFEKYVNEYGLSEKDARTIISSKVVADFYDESIKLGADYKNSAKVIKGEILRCLNNISGETNEIPISCADFVKIVTLAYSGKISQDGMKIAIDIMFNEDKDADTIIKEKNLMISEDMELIKSAIEEVLKNNENIVKQYKEGNEKVISFLIGQCNKTLKGKALPQTINQELKKTLDSYNI